MLCQYEWFLVRLELTFTLGQGLGEFLTFGSNMVGTRMKVRLPFICYNISLDFVENGIQDLFFTFLFYRCLQCLWPLQLSEGTPQLEKTTGSWTIFHTFGWEVFFCCFSPSNCCVFLTPLQNRADQRLRGWDHRGALKEQEAAGFTQHLWYLNLLKTNTRNNTWLSLLSLSKTTDALNIRTGRWSNSWRETSDLERWAVASSSWYQPW